MFLTCQVDFLLRLKDNLCLFALSSLEIKHKTRLSKGKISSVFIDKIYKEKRKRRKCIENCDNEILMRIQFRLEVNVYRQKL